MGIRMWPDTGTFDRSVSVARGGLVPPLFVVAVLVLLTGVRAFRRRKSSGGGRGEAGSRHSGSLPYSVSCYWMLEP
jgi:hypothetical protein